MKPALPLLARATVLAAALFANAPLLAGEPPPTLGEARAFAQMQAMQTQMGQDKRAFIDQQLQLSPQESARFWPVYDAHQVALAELNRRRLDNVLLYARAWNSGALDDDTARRLAKEALDIEKDEAVLLQRTFDRASQAIHPAQAARYLQVEAKVRALVRYQQAAQVPLAR